MWNKIFFLLVLNIVLRVISVVLNRFTKGFYWVDISHRVNSYLVSRYDLSKIPDYHFINWCYELFQKLNFTSVDLVSVSSKDNIQICAYEDSRKIYIKCLKSEPLSQEKKDDTFEEIPVEEIQQLVGSMKKDEVKEAFILTTGNFSSAAMLFADTLPEDYKVSLISGDKLTDLYRSVYNKYRVKSILSGEVL